jgi:hypothetical protein
MRRTPDQQAPGRKPRAGGVKEAECNPIVVQLNNQWQAWCKNHKPIWETTWTGQYSLAVHWANAHTDRDR